MMFFVGILIGVFAALVQNWLGVKAYSLQWWVGCMPYWLIAGLITYILTILV